MDHSPGVKAGKQLKMPAPLYETMYEKLKRHETELTYQK